MRLTIHIQGRIAIPVRVIPYITGWLIPPDGVASKLAQRNSITPLEGVFAYHLVDGEPRKMLPKEWDVVVADLEILGQRLKSEERFDQEKYQEWRKLAPACLPVGVFVWQDEFESAFAKTYSPYRFSFIDNEREGERELNYTPYIPADLHDMVIDGFQQLLQEDQPKQVVEEELEVLDSPASDATPALFPSVTIDVIAQMFPIYSQEEWKRMGKDAKQIPWLLKGRRQVKTGRGGSRFDPFEVAEGMIAAGLIGRERAYRALIKNAPSVEVKEMLQRAIEVGE